MNKRKTREPFWAEKKETTFERVFYTCMIYLAVAVTSAALFEIGLQQLGI